MSLLVLLNKFMFYKDDRVVKSKSLLHLIDFKFVFNKIMFYIIL